FRIRDGDRDFISVRAAKSPNHEDARIRISFDTRARYHDIANFLLSPDGRYLAIHTGETTPLEVWDLQTATRSLQLEGVSSHHSVDFSNDSRRLAVIQFDPTSQRDLAHIRSLPSGALETKFDRTARKFLRFSPKGDSLAVSTHDGFLIYDVKSKGLLADVPLPEDVLGYPVAWSASGKLLATGDNRCIRIWELDRIRRQFAASRTIDDVELNQVLSTPELHLFSPSAILHGHESHVHWLMFHPQADFLLASHSWDRTTRLWNVFTGREQLVMPHGPPRFSRDGASLAVARADALDLYDLCLGDGCQWIYGNGQRAQQLVFDPEGKWIGLGAKTGCHLWSLPTLRPLTTLPGQSAYGLALDGDRQSLLVGSDHGLFRWPMKVNATSLSIGPARMLLPTVANSFARVLAPRQG
ncbi:MAG TPA: WD40 repeat domain-containing protein, partial [Pirellulaceae bacterium]